MKILRTNKPGGASRLKNCCMIYDFNPLMVSRVELKRENIDCIVFWTKDPESIHPTLDFLEKYDIPFYFLFTVNPYLNDIEINLPPLDAVIGAFKKLSERVGNKRVIWRYDPVIFTDRMDLNFHQQHFSALAEILKGYTSKCIVSFLTLYKKCIKNLKGFHIIQPDPEHKSKLLRGFQEEAEKRGIQIQVCADEGDYSIFGIGKGKCIDDKLISVLTNRKVDGRKDPNQRNTCNCVTSLDIGAYNTCVHHCIYCYANNDYRTAFKNFKSHNQESPLLCGTLTGREKIISR